MKYYRKIIGGITRRYPTDEFKADYYMITGRTCIKLKDIEILEEWGVKMEEVTAPKPKRTKESQ